MPFSSLPTSTVDFLLITALAEERDAVLKKLPRYRQLPPDPKSIRTYFQADLPVTFPDGSTGQYRVLVMCLLGMGRVQAATATADAIQRWHPRYIVLVGIAGGIAARKVQIGDVLISDQIVDYELQKVTPQGLLNRWDVQRADPRLLDACNNVRGESWQASIQVKRPRKGKPLCHIGPIASGDKVLAFGDILAIYGEVWTKLLGVEMEAAGAATAAFQASDKPGFFMVRGVSDLADENKGSGDVEKWRLYACDVAAAFLVELLKSGPVPLSNHRSRHVAAWAAALSVSVIVLAVASVVWSAISHPAATPTPTTTATRTPTGTPPPPLTSTYTPGVTATSAPTDTPSASLTPSVTPTITPTPCTPFLIDALDDTPGWKSYVSPAGKGNWLDPRFPLASVPGLKDKAIQLAFNLQPGGWVGMYKAIVAGTLPNSQGLQFSFLSTTPKTIELKLFKAGPVEDILCDDFDIDSSRGMGTWRTEQVQYASLHCSDGQRLDPKQVMRIDFAISLRSYGEAGKGEVTIDDLQTTCP